MAGAIFFVTSSMPATVVNCATPSQEFSFMVIRDSSSSFYPIERALAPRVNKPRGKDSYEYEHLHEYENRYGFIRNNDCPGEKKEGFDVEYYEEDGYDEEVNPEVPGGGVSDRLHAALPWGELVGVGIPRAQHSVN